MTLTSHSAAVNDNVPRTKIATDINQPVRPACDSGKLSDINSSGGQKNINRLAT